LSSFLPLSSERVAHLPTIVRIREERNTRHLPKRRIAPIHEWPGRMVFQETEDMKRAGFNYPGSYCVNSSY